MGLFLSNPLTLIFLKKYSFCHSQTCQSWSRTSALAALGSGFSAPWGPAWQTQLTHHKYALHLCRCQTIPRQWWRNTEICSRKNKNEQSKPRKFYPSPRPSIKTFPLDICPWSNLEHLPFGERLRVIKKKKCYCSESEVALS